MKFTTHRPDFPSPIVIQAEVDDKGYAWVTANGVRMLFVDHNGVMNVCRDDTGDLEKMGFAMTKRDKEGGVIVKPYA